MKKIKLSSGKYTKVDNCDYDWILEFGKNWSFDRYAYCTRQKNYERTTVRMHRLIAEKVFGEIPKGKVVDHINRDRLDNRRSNLRLISNGDNIRNQPRQNGSAINGVTKCWNKWRAYTTVNYKPVYLGRFDTREEAETVYKEHMKKLGVTVYDY